jgi:hypothetical protein
MKETICTADFPETSVWRILVRPLQPLERETSLFLLVSGLDLLMTCLLLGVSMQGGFKLTFYECNPIADFFLYRWGIVGFASFKLFMVIFIATIVQIIAREMLETARKVINFGNVVVAVVVIYASTLYLRGSGIL